MGHLTRFGGFQFGFKENSSHFQEKSRVGLGQNIASPPATGGVDAWTVVRTPASGLDLPGGVCANGQ